MQYYHHTSDQIHRISSFLNHRWNKALHKAVKAMESKTTIQCNKLIYIENSVPMYGIYNADTL